MASKKSDNTSSALSRPARRIIENFFLVWLDAHLNESTADFKNSLVQLKRVVASIETYKDAEECINFIQQVKDQKVFMIVSGAAGQTVVPEIHEWTQINSIYIFCADKPFHEKWSKNYHKVKGVHTNVEPICKALEIDRQRCDQNTISVSFQSGDPLFMYTQLVKEAILQIKYDEAASHKELVAFCRQQDDIVEEQIKLVEEEYNKHKPIWWYTAPIFMYSMLNRGLRVFDVDILMKMGFFMSELDRHIQELSRQQHANPKGLKIISKARFEVYRGQGLSTEDFEKLKQSKGGLMSFNNFLSTSYNKDVSLRDFAWTAAFLTDSVGILFIMQIDTDLCRKAKIPFVEIAGDIGYFKDNEAEILFTTHTLFKIENVQQITDPHTNRLYQVHLTVSSPDKHELKDVIDNLNKEIGNRKGLAKLANILKRAGLLEQARDVYHALLEKATTDNDIVEYNYQLGWMYNRLGEYEKAIKYYKVNLEYMKKTMVPYGLRFATTYNQIGNVYRNMGDYSKALSSYQKALATQKQVLPPNHPSLAVSYNDIGNVYINMGGYSDALFSHQKALEIRKQVLPPNHPDSAYSYNNIGLVYDNMGDYSDALEFYRQALEIWGKTLPSSHASFGNIYNGLGSVYDNMNDYSKAVTNFETAVKIREKALPPTHIDLATSYNDLGTTYAKVQMFSEASRLLEKAMNIRKESLSRTHPDLATSYWSLGLMYNGMGEYGKALSYHEQALALRKQVLSSNHSVLGKSYKEMGSVYRNMRNHTKALLYYEEALRIWQNSIPKTHSYISSVKKDIEHVKRKIAK